jgi:hypothetical protein
MKNLLTILLLITALSVKSATIINTTSVSGVWTLSGSPYLIQNEITISANTQLSVQPGVEVIFQGYFNLKVFGSVRCIGNSASPITFKMNDTTGWYNDELPVGGWRGIDLQPYSGSAPDSSGFSYCIIKDVKYGSPVVVYNYRTFTVWNRNLHISHCEFYHNQSNASNSDGYIMMISNSAGYTVEIDHCDFHHNLQRVAMVRLENYIGTADYFVHHNSFHHNTGGASFWTVMTNAVFEDNEVNNNISTINFGNISLNGGHTTIRRNKVHHNQIESGGSINSTDGTCIIESNLVCNNFSTKASCGMSDGGAGIRLSGNGSLPVDSNVQIVRNNIIANNHCEFYGGALYVCYTKASIMNNQIINNTARMGGAALASLGTQSVINMKNNILYGNKGTIVSSNKEISVLSCDQLHADYNWMEHPFSTVTYTGLITTLGDTSHNIIASNPMLVMPTTTAGISDDATIKDFDLTVNSITCIDQGDTVGAFSTPIDYVGNTRFQGTKIDIGAYEYQGKAEAVKEIKTNLAKVYPNPVSETLHILFNEKDRYVLTVFTITGATILTREIDATETTLETRAWTPGIYILKIENKKGQHTGYTIGKQN